MVNETLEKMVAPARDKNLKSLSILFGYHHRHISIFPRTSNLELRSLNLGPRSSAAGFTLLELLVVIVLLSLSAALVVPLLPSPSGTALKNSARSTAAMLRYLSERSAGSKNIYRLHINFSENSIKVTRKLSNGEEVPPDDPLFSRKLLEDGVVISDMQSPRLGKVAEGEVLIDFGAAGLTEFLTLHLSSPQGDNFTVAGYPGGKVKLLEGYQELTL